jgi:hypothetical protein
MNMEVTLPDQDDDDEGWMSSSPFDFWAGPILHSHQSETNDFPMSFDAGGGAAPLSDTTLYSFQQTDNNFDSIDTALLGHLLPAENDIEDLPL